MSRLRPFTVAVGLVAALACVSCGTERFGPARATRTPAPTLSVNRSYITGLDHPWDMAFIPNGTMFFTERAGRIKARLPGGAINLLAAPSDVVQGGEGGMLGIAVDPGFARNRFLYTCMTSNRGGGPTRPRRAVGREQLRYRPLEPHRHRERDQLQLRASLGLPAALQARHAPLVRRHRRRRDRQLPPKPVVARRQDPARRRERRRHSGQPRRHVRPPYLLVGPSQRAGHRVPARHRVGVERRARHRRRRRDQLDRAGQLRMEPRRRRRRL